MKQTFALLTALLLPLVLFADELERLFQSPPQSAKPGVMWMWMGCNISAPSITRDLEVLCDAGFGRILLFSLSDTTTPWANEIGNSPTPEIIAWTEPWWKLVRHAVKESKRLEMDFGMFNGPSYETSGGRWVKVEHSMQEICFSKTPRRGPGKMKLDLPRPTVDPRAVQLFPMFNPNTGNVEKLEIPERRTFYRDIAVLALPATGTVAKDRVFDLTGKTEWDAPAGDWVVYRFGHTTMGTLIQPAQWKATGFECDKMSAEAVTLHMKHVIGEIKKHLGNLVGDAFTFVHLDSYEAGKPSWTPRMREEFTARRGYDLTPFLTTFDGRIVGSPQETEKFREDFEDTIKDLYRDIHFALTSKLLREAGLIFSCEPYGGPWRPDDVLPHAHRVMTEFWTRSGKLFSRHLDETVAAARKSGQNIIEAEAFTGHPRESQWTETPAWLKPIGDTAYCAGVNRFILHRYVPQPWDDRYKPGNTMGLWGTHFDRTQTWWEPGKAMVKYWQRCQALLQWGRLAAPEGDFAALSLQGGVTVNAIHRRQDGADVYFLANTARSAGSAKCRFRVGGRQPELWDPVTGNTRDLAQFEQVDGATMIPLEFEAAQSFFIVFRKPATTSKTGTNFPVLRPVRELDGPWTVRFDPDWGGPKKPVTFAKLEDWTRRPEPGIRYFSGTAVYTKGRSRKLMKTCRKIEAVDAGCVEGAKGAL